MKEFENNLPSRILEQDLDYPEPVVSKEESEKTQTTALKLSMNETSYISGTFTQGQDGLNGYLYIEGFNVDETMRNQGIGVHLLACYVREGKAMGATELYGEVVHIAALKARAKLFGAENLTFFDPLLDTDIPITYEQALQSDDIHFWVRNAI